MSLGTIWYDGEDTGSILQPVDGMNGHFSKMELIVSYGDLLKKTKHFAFRLSLKENNMRKGLRWKIIA